MTTEDTIAKNLARLSAPEVEPEEAKTPFTVIYCPDPDLFWDLIFGEMPEDPKDWVINQ